MKSDSDIKQYILELIKYLGFSKIMEHEIIFHKWEEKLKYKNKDILYFNYGKKYSDSNICYSDGRNKSIEFIIKIDTINNNIVYDNNDLEFYFFYDYKLFIESVKKDFKDKVRKFIIKKLLENS